MRTVWKLVVLALTVALFVSGCSSPSAAITNTALPTTVRTASAPQTVSPVVLSPAASSTPQTVPAGWQADGVIDTTEYTHQGTAGPLTAYWRNDAEYLYIALQARTSGWLSIGFDPERTHIGADIIIGTVTSGGTTLLDSYGTAERGTYHTPDTELGGTNDIVAYGGALQGGISTIEFQLPLDSGDKYDKALTTGSSVPVILAVGSLSDLTSKHSYATFGDLVLD